MQLLHSALAFSRSWLGELLDVKITLFYSYHVLHGFIRSACSLLNCIGYMSYVEDMDCRSKMEGSAFARYSECGALVVVLS